MKRVDLTDIKDTYKSNITGNYKNKHKRFNQISSALLTALALMIAILSFFRLYPYVIIISVITILLIGFSCYYTKKMLYKDKKNFDEVYSSNENRGKVISDLSHRIRSPLSNLIVLGYVLNGTSLTKKQKDLTETIIASSNIIFKVINELILRSRIELVTARRIQIRFNLLSAIATIREIYSQNQKDIVFRTDTSRLDHEELIGDPIIIKQILIYLFNKIEATQSGLIVNNNIRIVENKLPEGEINIEFTIETDQPISFIEETDESLNPAGRLIKSNGGTYSQKIETGSAVFTFSLPFILSIPEESGSEVTLTIDREPTVAKKKELKDINILLVEDNPVNQKIVLLVLSSKVGNIDTAINGQEALDKFRSSKYDIILMDIHMPVMDGLTATGKIREMEADPDTHIPIIAITADAMLGDEEKCLSCGMDGYISKPFKPALLIEKIENFMNL